MGAPALVLGEAAKVQWLFACLFQGQLTETYPT
jgi:hypothetical protein